MRRLLLWGGLGCAAFLVWQWWLSRLPGDQVARDRERKAADALGRLQENLGIANRPRLASDERIGALSTLLTGANALWSQILPSGRVNNGDKLAVPPPVDPIIFGYDDTTD